MKDRPRRLGLLLILSACQPTGRATWPDWSGAQAIVELIAPPEAPPRVRVLDAREAGGAASLIQGSVVQYLLYEAPVEQLGLYHPVVGPPEAPGRRLPIPSARYQATAGEGLDLQASAATEQEAQVRIDPLELAECLDHNGCAQKDALENLLCAPGCPIPTPTAPAPVHAGPCPDGWTAYPDATVGACLPPARRSCPLGMAQFYGEAECQALGPGSADYPTALPPERTPLYVRPNATGGDGRPGTPLSLAAALAQAGPGVVLALGRGRFVLPGPTALPEGALLIGAGAGQTVVAATGLVAFVVSTASVGLADLQIEASTAIRADGAALQLRGLALGRPGRSGAEPRPAVLSLQGGQAVGEALRIETEDGALLARGGATITLRHTVLDGLGSNNLALDVAGVGTQLTLEQVSFNDFAAAVRVEDRASAHLQQTSFDAIQNGVVEIGREAEAEAETMVITEPRSGNTRRGLYAYADGRLSITELLMLGGGARTCAFSLGTEVQTATELTLRRAALLDCADEPLYLIRGNAHLEDVHLLGGLGAVYSETSTLTGSRVAVAGQTGIGLCLSKRSFAELSDLSLDGSAARTSGRPCDNNLAFAGIGLQVTSDSGLRMRQSAIRRARRGLHVYSAEVQLDEVLLEDCGLGLLWPAELDPFGALLGVVFKDNGEDLRREP